MLNHHVSVAASPLLTLQVISSLEVAVGVDWLLGV
jgi:hypothetical protein